MVLTRKKKQQSKKLFSQLNESDADLMIGQSNHEVQTESRANAAHGNISLNDTNNPTQVSGSQVDMHTLEKTIVNEVRSEVNSVMTTVETREQDAVLTAVEDLVILRVEQAMKSVNASTGRGVGSVVLNPDQRDFSRIIKGQQRTVSSRRNSHRDIIRIDETRGNIAVEGGDLLVNERNIDRPTHTHHIYPRRTRPSHKSIAYV